MLDVDGWKDKFNVKNIYVHRSYFMFGKLNRIRVPCWALPAANYIITRVNLEDADLRSVIRAQGRKKPSTCENIRESYVQK